MHHSKMRALQTHGAIALFQFTSQALPCTHDVTIYFPLSIEKALLLYRRRERAAAGAAPRERTPEERAAAFAAAMAAFEDEFGTFEEEVGRLH